VWTLITRIREAVRPIGLRQEKTDAQITQDFMGPASGMKPDENLASPPIGGLALRSKNVWTRFTDWLAGVLERRTGQSTQSTQTQQEQIGQGETNAGNQVQTPSGVIDVSATTTRRPILANQFHQDGSMDYDVYMAFHKAFASLVSADDIPDTLRQYIFGSISNQTADDFYDYWLEHGIDEHATRLLLGDTFEDPRRNIEASRQAGDARKQTVFEAIANSIDAILETQIGQFGMGIKQSEMWLDEVGDRVRIITNADGHNQYTIELYKTDSGIVFIKTNRKILADSTSSGTEFHIHKAKIIPKTRISEIADEAFSRYAYTPNVLIKINNVEVNNYEYKRIVFGETEEDRQRRNSGFIPLGHIDITIDKNDIVIRDTGMGMSARTAARMMVTGLGSKEFIQLNDEEATLEMQKIKVIHNPKGTPNISFSRNSEVVISYPLPLGMANIWPGGFAIEMGRLISVGYGRANVIVDKRWQEGILYVLDSVLKGSLSDEEQLTFVNSILASVDAMKAIYSKEIDQDSVGATETEVRLNTIYIESGKLARPLIERLQNQNKILIPNSKQWTRIRLPAETTNRVLYAHQSLISWRSNSWLREIGAHPIPVKVTVEAEPIVIWSVPFQDNDSLSIAGYRFDWDTDPNRIPAFFDQSGRVIIDRRMVNRFEELLAKPIRTTNEQQELVTHQALLEFALVLCL